MSDKKRVLPIVPKVHIPRPPPSVDDARAQLGGRASTQDTAGDVVVLRDKAQVGVVLFASDAECDVWIDNGRLRRVPPALLDPATETPDWLRAVSADARLFAKLTEGERVRYQTGLAAGGALREGTLVEKCRYGALVLGADGKVVAVGFRTLWPL